MSTSRSGPGVRRLLFLLSLCSFLVGWDSLVTVPLAPEIADSFGVDAGRVGWLVSAYALAYLVSAPAAGMVSDRIGRRPLLLIGVAVLGASTGAMFWAPGWGSVLVLRFVAGIGAGITQPGVYAMVSDEVPEERRASALGIVMGMLTASTILGVPLSGFISDAFGWRWSFMVLALVALGAVAVLWRMLPRTTPAPAGGPRGERLLTWRVVLILIATVLWFGSMEGVFANAGVLYREFHHLDAGDVSMVLMLAGGLSALGSWVGGRVVDRVGAWPVGLVCGAITIVGVLLTTQGIWNAPGGTIASHVVWSGAFAAGMTSITAIVSSLSEEARGTVLSLNSSAMYVGSLIFTGAAPFILGWQGFPGLGMTSAVALVASVGLLWVATPGQPTHEQRVQRSIWGTTFSAKTRN